MKNLLLALLLSLSSYQLQASGSEQSQIRPYKQNGKLIGIQLISVIPGSNLDKVGLLEGDIIVSINTTTYYTKITFKKLNLIGEMGDKVKGGKVTFIRKGKTKALTF